jgi:MFS family permease
MAAAPSLAAACAAGAIGGAGNGVQWVTVVSAVQELTSAPMQARVISVLESMSSAMPGIGYVLGGLIATGFDTRAAFAVAGVGAIVTALVAAPFLGTNWPRQTANEVQSGAADDDVMVELIPAIGAGISVERPFPLGRSGGSK